MKRLADLLQGLECETAGDVQKEITGITHDSRRVQPGNLFVAIDGFSVSGSAFIDTAIARGARAVLSSQPVEARGVVKVVGRNPRRLMAVIANRFYDDPSQAVKLIGITGTNGKTTTAWLIRTILEASGERSGMIGTIRHFDGQEWIKAANTTPESADIVQMLARLRSLGIGYCVVEVSSHALALERVTGLNFRAGVFTNFTQDHLDFHKTMEEYKQAKLGFFRMLGAQSWAVYNRDDPAGAEFAAATNAQKLAYGLEDPGVGGQGAEVRLSSLKMTDKLTTFDLNLPDASVSISSPLVGKHNVYNLVAAASVAWCLGIPGPAIRDGIRRQKAVPGRLERVDNKAGLTVFVDYAHSPDALKNLITTARTLLGKPADLSQAQERKVIVVFGCGGNRDKGKRPVMGRIASELADRVFITSDNPRDEDPDAIIEEIVAGAQRENFEVQVNRYDAIKRALFVASRGDIVLIAGKGHEDYQIIGKERRHFDDRETVVAVLGRG